MNDDLFADFKRLGWDDWSNLNYLACSTEMLNFWDLHKKCQVGAYKPLESVSNNKNSTWSTALSVFHLGAHCCPEINGSESDWQPSPRYDQWGGNQKYDQWGGILRYYQIYDQPWCNNNQLNDEWGGWLKIWPIMWWSKEKLKTKPHLMRCRLMWMEVAWSSSMSLSSSSWVQTKTHMPSFSSLFFVDKLKSKLKPWNYQGKDEYGGRSWKWC